MFLSEAVLSTGMLFLDNVVDMCLRGTNNTQYREDLRTVIFKRKTRRYLTTGEYPHEALKKYILAQMGKRTAQYFGNKLRSVDRTWAAQQVEVEAKQYHYLVRTIEEIDDIRNLARDLQAPLNTSEFGPHSTYSQILIDMMKSGEEEWHMKTGSDNPSDKYGKLKYIVSAYDGSWHEKMNFTFDRLVFKKFLAEAGLPVLDPREERTGTVVGHYGKDPYAFEFTFANKGHNVKIKRMLVPETADAGK